MDESSSSGDQRLIHIILETIQEKLSYSTVYLNAALNPSYFALEFVCWKV